MSRLELFLRGGDTGSFFIGESGIVLEKKIVGGTCELYAGGQIAGVGGNREMFILVDQQIEKDHFGRRYDKVYSAMQSILSCKNAFSSRVEHRRVGQRLGLAVIIA